MQPSPPSSAAFASLSPIRSPWPEELFRVKHLLPEAFLLDENPWLFVGTTGRVERLAAIGAMAVEPERRGTLYLWTLFDQQRVDWTTELARHALASARRHGLRTVRVNQAVEKNSQSARALIELGFEEDSITDIYAIAMPPHWERFQRMYARLRRLDVIPQGVKVVTFLPSMLGKVRAFLREHMPGTERTLRAESTGYKLAHSVVLFVQGEVKGVFMNRLSGQVSFAALRVVAPELRGGFGWGNFLLSYHAVERAVEAGCTESCFEIGAGTGDDIKQMAQVSQARLVNTAVLLRWDA